MSTSGVGPLAMEDHFFPGLRVHPAVHVGSQTMRLYRGAAEEQAWEGLQLAAASAGDVAVIRGIEPSYLTYWQELAGPVEFVQLEGADPEEFLTRALLADPRAIAAVAAHVHPDSMLAVFFPTELEAELARVLNVPLHGAPTVSTAYGTKSGVRDLACRAGISMPPGVVCRSFAEVREAMAELGDRFDEVIIKHDLATGGMWSRRWTTRREEGLRAELDRLSAGAFVDGRDVVVVEGWLRNAVAVCAHIEILPEQEPIVCAGWQQVMDSNGTTQIGSRPLTISPSALASFKAQAEALAWFLHDNGAIGSYGPDFVIVAEGGEWAAPGTSLLLELNARAPATAYALEIVKRVRNKVGTGFFSRHVRLPHPASFARVAQALEQAGLLVRHPAPDARGVVPYNVGLLPWGVFDVVAMADSWEECASIMDRVVRIFNNSA